jgi:hypothetical protein
MNLSLYQRSQGIFMSKLTYKDVMTGAKHASNKNFCFFYKIKRLTKS